MMIPLTPRRHPLSGPLPSYSLQGSARAHPTSLRLRCFLQSPLGGVPAFPKPPRTHPLSHSSPISFSLTLGGKLAIYGVPSDSGVEMRTQPQRKERRALRGVTRARSLPVPGMKGRGGGGRGGLCQLPQESSGRPRTYLRSQTQTIDPGLCLPPANRDALTSDVDCKRDSGDKMADGVDNIRAVGAGSRDVTIVGSAFRRSGREGLGPAPRPPTGGLRVFSGGITPARAGRAGRRGQRGSCSSSPAKAGPLSRNLLTVDSTRFCFPGLGPRLGIYKSKCL